MAIVYVYSSLAVVYCVPSVIIETNGAGGVTDKLGSGVLRNAKEPVRFWSCQSEAVGMRDYDGRRFFARQPLNNGFSGRGGAQRCRAERAIEDRNPVTV